MTDYIPLVAPTVPSTANYNTQAAYLASWNTNIAVSANSYLASLADLKQIDFSQVGDLPAFSSFTLLADMTAIGNRPVRPNVDTDISDLQAQLARLVVPPAPTTNFSYTDPGYSSALRDATIAKIMYDLLNGGYGIDPNDETNLFNRERDREALVTQMNIDEVKRQAASTSFPVPQGSMYMAIQKARQEQMAKLSSVNRDIGIKKADLYVDNRRFIIEKALASEEQSIGLYNAMQNRALEVAKVSVQLTIALFEAGYKYFEGQLRAILSQIEAQVKAEEMQVQLYASDVAAYTSYVNAVATQARVTNDNARLLLERDKTAYLGRVETVRFRLQQLLATIENAKTINQFGAEFFRTGLGASLSSLNGLAVQNSTV